MKRIMAGAAYGLAALILLVGLFVALVGMPLSSSAPGGSGASRVFAATPLGFVVAVAALFVILGLASGRPLGSFAGWIGWACLLMVGLVGMAGALVWLIPAAVVLAAFVALARPAPWDAVLAELRGHEGSG